MKFVLVSINNPKVYEFYLQAEDDLQYGDIKKRAAEVMRIKFNLPAAPEKIVFGVTAPFNDPREEELIDKDLWVFEPTISLATPASNNKHLAGKSFFEIREMVKEVIHTLKGLGNQDTSVPVRGGNKEYTVTTIVAELENLTDDGLRFLNDWLLNEIEMEVIRSEKR